MRKFSDTEKLFIKNLFSTAILKGLIGLLNYYLNIFVARNVTGELFGMFSASMGILYLLQIPFISLQNIITKKVGEERGLDVRKFKGRSLFIFTLTGLIFSTLFYLLRDPISTVANIPIEGTFALALVLLFSFMSPITSGILLGRERIGLVNIVLLIESALKFGIGYIAIQMGESLDLLILASAIPPLVSMLVVYPFIKNIEKINKRVSLKINYRELLLMAISFLLLSAPYTLDLILVNPAFRAEYSALTLIGKLVYFACITIASVMFARLVNQKNRKEEIRTLLFSIGLTFFIGAGVSFAIFILRDFVVDFAFGGKYVGITGYISIYSLSMTFYALVYMIVNYLMSKDNYWFILTLVIVTALQIFLFVNFNSDIAIVVRNQVIVYTVLIFLTIGNLIQSFIRNRTN